MMTTAFPAHTRQPVNATLDRAFRSVADWLSRHEVKAPGVTILARVRRAAAENALARYLPEAREIEQRFQDGGDAERARRALADLAERALADMRADVARRATTRPWTAAAARIDEVWYAPDASEHLDDPGIDEGTRQRLMHNLDRVNDLLGSYEAFYQALTPLLERARATKPTGEPVRVLDLAAGHGGFALWAAERARREQRRVHFTVTDLKDEYLELGRARAKAEALAVSFRVQNALDLSSLSGEPHDVIVCTQALHHFPPGLIAPMFANAYRAARSGVLFVDGCRTAVHALPVAAVMYLHYRDPALAHDAVVSLRRFFTPEELGLLCRLGPWKDDVEVRWRAPGHCTVSATKTTSSRPHRAPR